MATFNEDRTRRIIPRWKNLRAALEDGDLLPLRPRTAPIPAAPDLERVLSDWQREKTEGHALDAVSAAMSHGLSQRASDAAEFLSGLHGEMSPALRRALDSVLLRAQPEPPLADVGLATLHDAIHEARSRLNSEHRDAYGWLDLGRLYESIGQSERSQRCVVVAAALSPNDRFVVRCAARMFVHHDDPERAHVLLKECPRTPHDPWLTAAEIAVASTGRKGSLFASKGREMLSRQQFAPRHLSELASALGTAECESGNSKAGRRLIRESLSDPTENAVAQAAWTARRFGAGGLDEALRSLSLRSPEASAWNAVQGGRWTDGVSHCKDWFAKEPFSSRPAIMASFLTSFVLGDLPQGEMWCKHGLRANPRDFTLHNNLAVALAQQGKSVEGRREWVLIDEGVLSEPDRVVHTATDGLIKFREGRVTEGRSAYSRAVAIAEALKDEKREFVARLFWAMEEVVARTERAYELAKHVVGDRRASEYTEIKPMVERLRVAVENIQASKAHPSPGGS